MEIEKRKKAFLELGKQLVSLSEVQIKALCQGAAAHNTWFDEKSVRNSLKGLATLLEQTTFEQWLDRYHFADAAKVRVGLIMAGNIPMVGIHDLICVLVSGHQALVKLSSQDPFLIRAIVAMLLEIEPLFAEDVQFVDQLKEAQAVIATGSNNSARYFEYYFAQKPHIIRKNRVSVAVLNGEESDDELRLLADDMLLYYGLGCRNVAKVYVPEDYDLGKILLAAEGIGQVACQNHKYANNYDYIKSIYLINQVKHLDNGYMLITENEAFASPSAVVFYQYYRTVAELSEVLLQADEQIQCVVSKQAWWQGSIAFGEAQFPKIDDYADGVDTMKFLLSL